MHIHKFKGNSSSSYVAVAGLHRPSPFVVVVRRRRSSFVALRRRSRSPSSFGVVVLRRPSSLCVAGIVAIVIASGLVQSGNANSKSSTGAVEAVVH